MISISLAWCGRTRTTTVPGEIITALQIICWQHFGMRLGGLAKSNFDEANFKGHQQAEDNASQASLHIGEIDAGGGARIVNVFSGSADVTIDRVDIGGSAQVINLFLDDETIARLRQIQPANHSTEIYPRY